MNCFLETFLLCELHQSRLSCSRALGGVDEPGADPWALERKSGPPEQGQREDGEDEVVVGAVQRVGLEGAGCELVRE